MNSEDFCNVLHKRINRARTNIALVHAELSRNTRISEIAFGSLCYLQDCINQLETECDDVDNAISRAIKLAERLTTPITKSEPRRTSRIVPDPVDEMMDGSVNSTLAPNHPYFQDHPLIYVHGGPSTCILCKETHPCGCRPPTPAERSAFQSPIPNAQAIPEESFVTRSGCPSPESVRSRDIFPSFIPESIPEDVKAIPGFQLTEDQWMSMDDSGKALLKDQVFKK